MISDTQPTPQAPNPTPAPLHPEPRPNSPIPPSPRRKRHGPWRDIWSTIAVLLAALVVAFGLIAFVFQSYQVDGPSMEQTLQNNDRLIVWKLPRTWARITGHEYVPKRGDIIVFTESGLATYGQQDTKQLIKRVIGLPNDRIVIKDNVVTVYDKQHPSGFDPDKTLGYHNQITETTTGNIDITLAKNQLFVMGDNRTDSLDSRIFGPISTGQVVGKLIFRLLPIDNAQTF